jgi:hypothetical protein
VHEARHAVGRILAAPADEWRAEEAIEQIEIRRTPRSVGVSIDGRADLGTSSIYLGKNVLKANANIRPHQIPSHGGGEGADFAVVATEMRAAGLGSQRLCWRTR